MGERGFKRARREGREGGRVPNKGNPFFALFEGYAPKDVIDWVRVLKFKDFIPI